MPSFSEIVSGGLQLGQERARQNNERRAFSEAITGFSGGNPEQMQRGSALLAAAGNPQAAMSFAQAGQQQRAQTQQATQAAQTQFRQDLLNAHVGLMFVPEDRRGEYMGRAFGTLSQRYPEFTEALQDDGRYDDASLKSAIATLGGYDTLVSERELGQKDRNLSNAERGTDIDAFEAQTDASNDAARLALDEGRFALEGDKFDAERSLSDARLALETDKFDAERSLSEQKTAQADARLALDVRRLALEGDKFDLERSVSRGNAGATPEKILAAHTVFTNINRLRPGGDLHVGFKDAYGFKRDGKFVLAGSDRKSAEALVEQITADLTLEKAEKLKGVLSDRDMQLLAAASSRLSNRDIGDAEARRALDEIRAIFEMRLRSFVGNAQDDTNNQSQNNSDPLGLFQ